jgi:hypothetical protein
LFRPVVPERANLNINWCACRRFSSHRLHSRCHRHCVPLLTHGYMSNQHSLLSLLRSRMSSKGKRIYVNSRPRAVGIRRLCAMYGIGTISACPVLVWVRPTSHIPQPLRSRRVRPFMRLAWIYNVYCIVFVYIPVTRIGLTTRGALHRMPLMEERLKPGEPPSGPPPQPFSHPGATRIAAAGIAPSPAPPRGRFTCRLTRGSSLCGSLALPPTVFPPRDHTHCRGWHCAMPSTAAREIHMSFDPRQLAVRVTGPPPHPFSHPGATRIAAAGIAPSPAPPREIHMSFDPRRLAVRAVPPPSTIHPFGSTRVPSLPRGSACRHGSSHRSSRISSPVLVAVLTRAALNVGGIMAPEVTVEDIELKRLDAVATLDTKHVNEMKRLDQEDLLESSNVCITNSTARCTVLTNLMAQHVPDGPGPQGATSSTCSREHRHLVPPRVRDHHTRVREHHHVR